MYTDNNIRISDLRNGSVYTLESHKTNETKEGFYSVEPLNNELTRIALVWNNIVWKEYGNETVSKEIVEVVRYPKFLIGCISRSDIENTAKELMEKHGITECAVQFI